MLSVTQLVVILAIVLVLFGAKKLRNIGGDLGGAIKNFRASVKEGEADATPANPESADRIETGRIIEADEVIVKKEDHVNRQV